MDTPINRNNQGDVQFIHNAVAQRDILRAKKFRVQSLHVDDAILFTASTPLGFQVRVTRAYWEIIVTVKHPAMEGREEDVKQTLEDPDEIRQSKSMKVCICFIGENVKSAGFVQSQNEQAMKAF